jgi:predicted TPR repeat methyltransferase
MPGKKSKTKSMSAGNLSAKAKTIMERVVKVLFGVVVNLGKAREVATNNYNLGQMHLKRGNFDDAVLRFKMVTWLEPKNEQAWYFLGNSYLLADKRPQAVAAYDQAIALRAGHEEALYMRAIARGSKATASELPVKIPQSLLIKHFEDLAPSYDQAQLTVHKYHGHELMAAATRTQLMKGRVDHEVLDLGCGTGLCGVELRDVAFEMTGVDISEAMIAQAMRRADEKGKRKIYDALIRREVHEFLVDARDDHYDIVLAGKLPIYLGDLAPLFAGVSRILKKGGVFVYTADILEGNAGFKFNTADARFNYSESYLKSLAQSNGLSEVKLDKAPVYSDFMMWLGVLKK